MLVLALFAGIHSLRAQQDPMFSQYMFNTLAFNPAYAGSADVFTAMALSRHQWVGFDGAPSTQTLSLHSPLPVRSLAVGGNIIHDKAGPITQTGAFLDVAYRFKTGETSKLALGLSGGVNLFQAALGDLATVDPDPSNSNLNGEILPNFGFGAFWHAERYYLGISVPKLLQNDLNPDRGAVMTKSEEERHYFLIAGYVKDLSADLKVKPSVMARAVEGAPLSMDINLNFLLRNRIWFGGMYRISNSFGVMAQYQFTEQLKAGYAFDMTTTKVGAYNAGTHEIMVGYDLKWTKGNIISPRYF
jgi:type IX secretion system PorP/SprF family membrane protein